MTQAAPVTAFPIEKLREAGIPSDAVAELTVTGCWRAWGTIPEKMFRGTPPPQVEFEDAATAHEVRVIESAVLRFSRPNSAWSAELFFEFSPSTVDEQINRLAFIQPVAIWEVSFQYGQFRQNNQFTVAELLLMTYAEDELWLDGHRIACDDEDWCGDRYYWVMWDGHKVAPHEFSWWPSGATLDSLMGIIRHDLSDLHAIAPCELGAALRDEPELVANLVKAFIARHGHAYTKTLLGADNLDAVLSGRLWENLDPKLRVSAGQLDFPLGDKPYPKEKLFP